MYAGHSCSASTRRAALYCSRTEKSEETESPIVAEHKMNLPGKTATLEVKWRTNTASQKSSLRLFQAAEVVHMPHNFWIHLQNRLAATSCNARQGKKVATGLHLDVSMLQSHQVDHSLLAQIDTNHGSSRNYNLRDDAQSTQLISFRIFWNSPSFWWTWSALLKHAMQLISRPDSWYWTGARMTKKEQCLAVDSISFRFALRHDQLHQLGNARSCHGTPHKCASSSLLRAFPFAPVAYLILHSSIPSANESKLFLMKRSSTRQKKAIPAISMDEAKQRL